jgi:hypothetical protein
MAVAPANELVDEVTSFLAAAPTAEEIIAFKVSDRVDQRLHDLLDRNSADLLTSDERAELDEYMRMNHFLIMLKLKTRLKLAGLE